MTNPISMTTAHRIWMAHREIEVGTKLLEDIAKTLAEGDIRTPIDERYRWRRGYSLGVPSGSGERILDVSPFLAAAVVKAHIADKQRELVEATLAAKIEIETDEAERKVTDG